MFRRLVRVRAVDGAPRALHLVFYSGRDQLNRRFVIPVFNLHVKTVISVIAGKPDGRIQRHVAARRRREIACRVLVADCAHNGHRPNGAVFQLDQRFITWLQVGAVHHIFAHHQLAILSISRALNQREQIEVRLTEIIRGHDVERLPTFSIHADAHREKMSAFGVHDAGNRFYRFDQLFIERIRDYFDIGRLRGRIADTDILG